MQQVMHAPSHDLVCGFFDGGMLATWDAAGLSLSAVFAPEREDERRSPFISCAISRVDPYVFVCTANTKHTNVVDLANRSTFKLRTPGKKPVVAVATHPSQPILAAVSADGEVRLWDYQNQSVISTVEAALPPSARYFVSFDGSGRHLVVATPSGHVCAWSQSPSTGPTTSYSSSSSSSSSANAGPTTSASSPMPTASGNSQASGQTPTSADDGASNLAFLGSTLVPGLTGGSFDSLVVHQMADPPVVLTAFKGTVTAWDLVKPEQPKQPILRPSRRMSQFSFLAAAANRVASLPAFARSSASVPPAAVPSSLLVHVSKNLVTCIPHAAVEYGDGGGEVLFFEARPGSFSSLGQVIAPLPTPPAEAIAWGETSAFAHRSPNVIFLGQQLNEVYSHNFETGVSCKAVELTPPPAHNDCRFVHASKISVSYIKGVTAVVYETHHCSPASPPTHQFALVRSVTVNADASSSSSSSSSYAPSAMSTTVHRQFKRPLPGKNVVFCGESEETIVALLDGGMVIDVGATELVPELHMKSCRIPAGSPAIESIFAAPLDESRGLAVVALVPSSRPQCRRLVMAYRESNFDCSNPSGGVDLLPDETPMSVTWQKDDTAHIGAILTTRQRVIFVSQRLDALASFDLSRRTSSAALSIFWAGWALLYTTETHLKALFADGSEQCLLSLNTTQTTICGVLPDRVLLCCGSIARYTVYARPVSLLEPLVTGEYLFSTALRSPRRPAQELADRLSQLASQFEWQRLSSSLVGIMSSAGLHGIANAMASHRGAFATHDEQIGTALAACQVEKAVSLQVEAAQAIAGDARVGAHHHLRSGERTVALTSYACGHRECAKKCLDASGDSLGLLMHSVLVAADPQSVAAVPGEPGVADSATLAAVSKFLASQRLTSVTNATPTPAATVRSPYTTCSTRAVATVAGKPISRLLWVDNPNHWFPASVLEIQSSGTCDVTAGSAPVSAAPPKHVDIQVEMLRIAPPITVPSALEGKFAKSAVDYEIPSFTSIEMGQKSVAELAAPDVEDPDRELEPDMPPSYRPAKKLNGPFRPQPYAPKEVALAEVPASPAPRPVEVSPVSGPAIPASGSPSMGPKAPGSSPPLETRPKAWSRGTASPSLSRTSTLRTELVAAARTKVAQSQDDVLSSQEYKDTRAQVVQCWNQRQYDLCQKSVVVSIKIISTALAARADDQVLLRELRQAVAYRIAVAMLKQIIALSSDASKGADVAMLSKFLADLPLQAQHRLDCIRLAIDKNITAENYGVAARLIQVLMPHNLPDSRDQAEKFKVCKAHKWSDRQLPNYSCPACKQKISAAVPECQCGTPVKFCCTGFKLLEGPVVTKCNLCDVPFNRDQQAAGVACPVCEAGTVEELNLETAWQERLKQATTSTTPPPQGEVPKQQEPVHQLAQSEIKVKVELQTADTTTVAGDEDQQDEDRQT